MEPAPFLNLLQAVPYILNGPIKATFFSEVVLLQIVWQVHSHGTIMEVCRYTKPAAVTVDDLRQSKAFSVFTIFMNKNNYL